VKDLLTLIITGLSGAGKTTALRAVEDLGFYCADNLPLSLLEPFVETMKDDPDVERAALVVDARLSGHIQGYSDAVSALRRRGDLHELVYLDARDEVLIQRFSQTRRRHPLGGNDLSAGLAKERDLLAGLRDRSTLCLDTSDLTVHQLKGVIQDRYALQDSPGLVVSFTSFGFRYGLPTHADLVFDVRFLRNPYFVEGLRPLTGLDPRVSDYVLQAEDAERFLEHVEGMLAFLLPRYEAEGKVYLTVAIGCTGGRHRSVALAEELGRRVGEGRPVNVRHRDTQV
jgi:RNase adapter protein RapZ